MKTLKTELEAAGVTGKPTAQPQHIPKSFRELRAELIKARTERDLLMKIVTDRK